MMIQEHQQLWTLFKAYILMKLGGFVCRRRQWSHRALKRTSPADDVADLSRHLIRGNCKRRRYKQQQQQQQYEKEEE